MSQTFGYVRYDDAHAKVQGEFKARFEELEGALEILGPSRPVSLAKTKLEEAYMWIGKAIRDDQIAVGGSATEEPKRG